MKKIDTETDGPVAQRKDGSPWPDRQSFSRDWRETARAAGIPDNVKNLDSRASGVTDASEAGVSDDDIIKQTGHVDKMMVQEVYTRDGLEVSRRSHEQRQRHREAKRQTHTPQQVMRAISLIVRRICTLS
ncbi:hypothetical protein [Afipia felis]|uniref:hypothetical protein n=1 Tax=Afipia felis TaxID=1035 RepID=UPI000660FB66|nr:hypothetical protein [Afipia felis]